MHTTSKQYAADKVFLYEYHHMGSTWVMEVPASDELDAKARIRKMQDAEFLGVRAGTVPAEASVETEAGATAHAVFGLPVRRREGKRIINRQQFKVVDRD